MSSSPGAQGEGVYGRFWDWYVQAAWPDVRKSSDQALEWPGDEWGTPESWDYVYRQLFVTGGVQQWRRAVEIGPGSGKYTLKVLGDSECTVRGYDVSPQFMRVCETRCREWIEGGRLSLHQLSVQQPDQMLTELEGGGWRRSVDGFYSIDAMVHVDLQYLIVYLITAGLVLRPGGSLVLTLADATSRLGLLKLLQDARVMFPYQDGANGSGKFEWLSPDIVRTILPALGFELSHLEATDRDMYVVASLRRPDLADAREQYIRP
jgi:hypothetical protein